MFTAGCRIGSGAGCALPGMVAMKRLPAHHTASVWRCRAAVALLSIWPVDAVAAGITPRDGYTAVAALSSPHAVQASAADRDTVYAISSTVVARYDRCTARLLDVATGPDTRHLNSGFLHDGRLYLAHSNYPESPPESDIRMIDPATGRLEVFHRFTDPPGSLVWCVKREEAWWCCFAHYGAENHRTMLVQYSEGFDREIRRVRFPAKVVADWDGMSGSGGLWMGDTLLVSHHHHRVLYRLAVPRDGEELELVEALHCPFPGQGIAADPATGGLVGIDRACRRVLFARPVKGE